MSSFGIIITTVLLAQNTMHCNADPVECSFEADMCTFQQLATAEVDWIRYYASSQEPGTGPSQAYDGQYYITARGMHVNTGDEARLVSPVLWFKGNVCVEFAYYMHGPGIDSLSVYISTMDQRNFKEVWNVSGDQGDVWKPIKQQIYINDAFSKISMVARFESDVQSDIALDNITIKLGNCPNVDKSCRKDQYQCSDLRCLPGHVVCNRFRDCRGGEDERNCNCTSTEWKCDDGTCISAMHYCNNLAECPDSSDEMYCNGTCMPGQIKCDETRCISQAKVCDGRYNCIDHQDEMDCLDSCPSRYKIRCESGECIYSVSWCNGIVDCFDASDERAYCFKYCPNGRPKCSKDGQEFCLPNHLHCDGQSHCDGGLDEANCTGRCPAVCSNGTCLHRYNWCDGTPDCSDGEDELPGCDATCLDDEFQCSDGSCIPGQYECDRQWDCLGGEDERNCTCDYGFRCNNGLCQPYKYSKKKKVPTATLR